jgi:putative phage-type endonuclease
VNALSVHEADWHAQRAKGIGASDVPAIAGVSTYATPIDIWQEKVGLMGPSPETALSRWGNLLEPVIAEEAERVLGLKFRRLARAVHYADWPILFAHLDRTSSDAILECKSSMTTKGWGLDGSDDVPDYVALQVQAQLAASGKELAYVAALIGYRDFRTYRITRDRTFFGDLVEPLLREFWTLVETNTPPEPDGSDGYGSFVRRRFPTSSGDERAATPEEHLIGAALIQTTVELKRAEAREAELKQRLMSAMGSTGKLDGPGWRAIWRQQKDRSTVHWDLIADGLLRTLPETERSALLSIHTEMKAGTRPFLFKSTEGDE